MADPIDSAVVENRRRIQKTSGRFVAIDVDQTRGFNFGVSLIAINPSATLYRRSTGTQAVFGHPSDSKGFGRGTFGDDKREWIEVEAETEAAVSRDGKRKIARLLDGESDGIARVEDGYGDQSPDPTNDQLQNPSGDEDIRRRDKPDVRTERVIQLYSSTALANAVAGGIEFGFITVDGVFFSRFTAAGDPIDPTDEVRGDFDFEVEGLAQGESVITSDGEEAIADALRPDTSIRLEEFAIGRPGSITKSSSALSDEVFRTDAARELGYNDIGVTAEFDASDADPADLPFEAGEFGIYDSSGRLVWATPVSPFDVDAETTFNAEAFFRIS